MYTVHSVNFVQVCHCEVRPHGEEPVEPVHASLQLLHQQVPLRNPGHLEPFQLRGILAKLSFGFNPSELNIQQEAIGTELNLNRTIQEIRFMYSQK